MTYLDAVIMGLVEGFTEFLPVSSTGHMIIVAPLIRVDQSTSTWSVFLFVSQFGAILAVILYFWPDLWRRFRSFTPRSASSHLFTKLIVAMLPSVVVGLAANDFMEEYLETNPVAVAGALIVGAVAMELIERRFRRQTGPTLDDVTYRQALIIGLGQVLSIWPGTSRSMATIMAGMLAGLPVRTAAEFSFFIAIPTMLLASAYKLLKHFGEIDGDAAGVIGVGMVTAFVTALIVVAGFMQFIRSNRFTPFAVYRVALGVAVLWYCW
ncbi:MAG: Undecaprenyl-diphosphatase [Phycisphaerae bacterium]|nr:Undecaprenyl-diphosphatase [Phycisphaerae bacterium]